MRVISYPRRGGKTIWLVNQVMKDPNGILVCMDASEADRIVKEYPDLPVGRIITVPEAVQGGLRGLLPEPTLYIDNADMILSRIFNARIKEISVTQEV